VEACDKAGDIYKKAYEGLYCVGCEAFYTSEEVDENQECFEHPGKKLEKVAEENYFFRLSKYQDKLVDLIEKDELRIVPTTRKNEVLSFLKQPLQDISISRSNERAKNWGVSIPGDDSQRMYVWFDALNIYQSGVGFGLNEEQYKKWWPADVHVIGKGITRFHAVYWPAFLLSAGLPLPKTLFVHGYITADGKKMSKSLGNVVDPFDLIEKYGTDAVRYFLLREIPSTEDGDFSYEKFETRFNADLADGLGNLLSRTLALKKDNIRERRDDEAELVGDSKSIVENTLSQFGLEFVSGALEEIWEIVHRCDAYIDREKPWEGKDNTERVVGNVLFAIHTIAELLKPFLPVTSEKITQQLHQYPWETHQGAHIDLYA